MAGIFQDARGTNGQGLMDDFQIGFQIRDKTLGRFGCQKFLLQLGKGQGSLESILPLIVVDQEAAELIGADHQCRGNLDCYFRE
jgi:hypothetical protein